MVIIAGREARVLPRILQTLSEDGVRAHAGVARGTSEDEDLFELVTELDAGAVVGVEPLAWFREPDAAAEDDALLERCLGAAQSPSRPRLVWVTARGADDEGLRHIRRSGVPYVVIRVAPLVPSPAQLVEPGREVLVPSDLPEAALGIATPDELAAAVADAVLATDVGRTVEIAHRGPDAWCEVVEALGGRPRRVGSFRAGAARLLGQPILELSGDALTVRGLGRRPHHSAEPAPSDGTATREVAGPPTRRLGT